MKGRGAHFSRAGRRSEGSREVRAPITWRLRRLLREGPATIPELHAAIPDETLRRVQVGVWVLTYSSAARVIGHIPCDEPGRRSKGNNIYALTAGVEGRVGE